MRALPEKPTDPLSAAHHRLAQNLWLFHGAGRIDDHSAQVLAEDLAACCKAAKRVEGEVPTFPAVDVEEDELAPVHIVAWCPWCETPHRHGAAGGAGHRAPHCAMDRKSPLLCTGYDLDLIGVAKSERAIIPAVVMMDERRLHQVMDRTAGALRSLALRALLGVNRFRGSVVAKRLRKGAVWIFGESLWLIEPKGKPPIEGQGLMRLAAALYGVPPGIAAVRLLEAVTCETLDAAAVFAIQRAVDQWAARGAPSRVRL